MPPVTTTTLTNITVIGPVAKVHLLQRRWWGCTVTNMLVEGVDLGVKYKTSDSAAIARIANGDLSVDIQFANKQGF